MPALQQCDYSPSDDGQSTRSIDAVGSSYTTSPINSLTTRPFYHLGQSTARPDEYKKKFNSENGRASQLRRKGLLPETPRMQQMTSRNGAVQNHRVATTTTSVNGVTNIPLFEGDVRFAISGHSSLLCSPVDSIKNQLVRREKQINHGRIMTGNGNDLEDANGRRSVDIIEQVLSEAEEQNVAQQIPVLVEQCSPLTTDNDLAAEFVACRSLSSSRSSFIQSQPVRSQFVATSAPGTNCSQSRVLPLPYPLSRQSAPVSTPVVPVDLQELFPAGQSYLTLQTMVAPGLDRQSPMSSFNRPQQTTVPQLTPLEMVPNDVKGVTAPGTYGPLDGTPGTLTAYYDPTTSIKFAQHQVTVNYTSTVYARLQCNEKFDINQYAHYVNGMNTKMMPAILGQNSFSQQQQLQQQQQQPFEWYPQLSPPASSASGDLGGSLSPSHFGHLSIGSTSPTTTTWSEDDTTSSSSFDRPTSSIRSRTASTASGGRQRQSGVRRRSSAASSGECRQQQKPPKVCDGCTTRRYNFEKREGSNVDAPRNYRCTVEGCGKAYKKSSHLHTHMFTHSDKKDFTCGKCSKNFRRADELKRHQSSVHSSEKNHICQLCDKRFARTDHLSQHQRIHKQSPRNSPQPSPPPTR